MIFMFIAGLVIGGIAACFSWRWWRSMENETLFEMQEPRGGYGNGRVR